MTKDELALHRYRYPALFMHGSGLSPTDVNWRADLGCFKADPLNLVKHLPLETYKNMLNAGGSIREARIFKELGYDCTTLGMVPSLREQFQDTDFKIIFNDLCEMRDIDNEIFDSIISIQCLEHVFYPWKAMLEFYRVLKNGGRIMINVPVWFKDQEDVDVAHAEVGTLQHCSVLQPYQLKFLVRQCGFKLVDHFIVEHQQTLVADKLSFDEINNWPHTKEWPKGIDLYYHPRLANFLKGYCEHPWEIKGEDAPDYAPEFYKE